MNLSKIKMVVSDMDGTLLNDNHEVSPTFFSLFEQLKKKGIKFVAASGRQYHSIINKLAPIKNDILVIAENGGLTMHKNEELHATVLPKRHIKNILSLLETDKNIHSILCTRKAAYVTNTTNNFTQILAEYYTSYKVVPSLEAVDEEILKIAIYHPESSEKYIYPLVNNLEDTLLVKVSGKNWVDVSSALANKGHALSQLMKQYSISADEILVFGDYLNDLEMLQLSNYSIAMKNAHPQVLKTASYVTKSNNELGVEVLLQQLLDQID